MHDSMDSRDRMIETLRDDMPPVAGQAELDRVRQRALAARAEKRQPRFSRRSLRIAAAFATVAGVLAVTALALAPRAESAAFASQQAADALLLQADGQVLHTVARYTGTGWNEQYGHDARYDIDQRWSSWIDPAGRRIRDESVNIGDGSLDGMTVRVGDRVVLFQNNVRYGTGDKQQLVEWPNTTDPFGSMLGLMVDQLRTAIAAGDAKPTGSTTIDGEAYWIVEYRIAKGDTLTVTMRKSDYRLKTWEREGAGRNGNGNWTSTERIEFETIEQLDPGTLPDNFFSVDEVIAAAVPNTPIDRR